MKHLFTYCNMAACVMITLLSTHFSAKAQKNKDPKTSVEVVKKTCEGSPLSSRPRVTVARFNCTVPAAPPQFGDNMATMLTNALQNTDCFRVLETLKNADDWEKETNYGTGDNANKASAIKKGKTLVAQCIVTGEVTEYSSGSKTSGVSFVSSTKQKVHIGFAIKLINPETREVLDSKSFDVDGKTKAATKFDLGWKSSSQADNAQSNPAAADAMEEGVIKAVEYITAHKDRIPLPPSDEEIANTNQTQVTIKNLDYSGFSANKTTFKGISNIKGIEAAFNDGIATYTLNHIGSSEDLADLLVGKLGAGYSVLGVGAGKIQMAKK